MDKQPVNDHQNRQEVAANEEIVFSYDVKFEVLPFTLLIMLSALSRVALELKVSCWLSESWYREI
jgi:hypothetical protein